MSSFLGSTPSAFDLTLEGTIGSFKVGKLDSQVRSLEVRYMLTHVSLDPTAIEDQKLLERLSPVREVFDLKQLDFDEIMQRDIDDARVSLELIPYLLDEENRGLIKLYPPIVAVVLPLEPMSRKPAKLYPESNTTITNTAGLPPGHESVSLTSGTLGQEVFQFEQVRSAQKLYKADGAKLKISTQNTALAIVDGQHRAMALLALYRNLKGGWNERQRQAYKHYYEVWPDSLIRKYDTKGIQLPVMLCTFPDLDPSYQGDFDVIRAARRIFLTLNKNARKVSDSRNKLLDDQDMASECLRETLSLIKDANTRSQTPLRIFNVELDQEGDRQTITNPFAITGVSHLYYICERILFLSDRVCGLTPKSIRIAARRQFHIAFHRLHLNDELPQQERDSTRRDNYADKVARAVEDAWRKSFGPLIVRLLGEVHPLKVHQNASLEKYAELERAVSEGALRAILFDGQGTAKVLERFETQLNANIKDDAANWGTPEIMAAQKTIEDLNAKRNQVTKGLRQNRAKLYFEAFKGTMKSKLRTEDGHIVKPFEEFAKKIVEEVFSTVALQAALVYTLIDMAEACNVELSSEFVDEYIQGINSFFAPTTDAGLRRLVGVMAGSIVETNEHLEIAPTTTTFRDIVYPGEMQPDEWPKYRYLILEIWKPNNPEVKKRIGEEIKTLRAEIIEKVTEAEIKKFLVDNSKLEASDAERAECRHRADERCKAFFDFLK
jgi:hypothetical protein